MSSLEVNKIAAAVLTAGVVAMASGFVADLLVHPRDLDEPAYPVIVAEREDVPADAEPEAPQSILPLLADADIEAGQAAFRPCAACHTYEEGGQNRVGPNLWDIVGAQHAHLDDFNYSSALEGMSDEIWTYEALDAFFADPSGYAPGTRMTYGGMRRIEDRANLIAWLRTLSDDPVPLPSEEEIAAVTGTEETAAEPEEEVADEPVADEPVADEPAAEDETTEAEVADEPAEPEEAVADADGDAAIREMIATADPAQGERVVRRCTACHTFDEGAGNRVGPNLWDVIGKPVAHVDDFNFSDTAQQMHDEGITWTYENLWAFLKDPRGWMPGTRMTFAGMRDDADLAALIAFMRTKAEDPPPLD